MIILQVKKVKVYCATAEEQDFENRFRKTTHPNDMLVTPEHQSLKEQLSVCLACL